jgi:hypothetical protein
MKKFIRILISGALLFGASFNVIYVFGHAYETDYNLDDIHEEFVKEFGLDFVENHNKSMETVQKLYDYFPTTMMGEVIYPAYFGGRYINEDGELVLLKVATRVPWVMPTFSYFDDTIVREVEFSFNELLATIDLLDATDSEEISNVSGWALDAAANRIIIYLIEYSEEAIDYFKSTATNSPKFVFEEGKVIEQTGDLQSIIDELNSTRSEPIILNPVISSFSTLRPGDHVWFWRDNVGWLGYLAIGYRANSHFQNGAIEAGFITAAHIGVDASGLGLRNGDVVADRNNVRIGVVNGAQLYRFDAAFVRLDNPNQLMATNSNSGNHREAIIQGQTTLWMNGGRSGWQRGQVIYDRITINMGPVFTLNGSSINVRVYNVIASSHFGQVGDSGSSVYATQVWNNETYITGVAGIHIAQSLDRSRSFISRADHIRTMFSPRQTFRVR